MRQCCEPAGSGFAVVAPKSLPPHPNPLPRWGEGTGMCKPDMVYTLDRGHGLHADALEKVGATHASPLRPARTPASDSLPDRARRRALCIFVSLSAVSFPCRNGPRKAGASRSSRRRQKTRNIGKAAPAAIQRDTAWLARPGPRGPDAAFLTPSASRARASIVHICTPIRR